MLKYIVIVIPGLYYMTAFTYGSVIFASTGSQLFREFYGFSVSQTGLMLSIPLLIGCVIGEANAGWLIDWMVVRHAKKHNGEKSPEARLDALWFGLLVPIGLIIEGVCLTHHRTAHWVGSAFGMGLANLGLQAATTVTYAYTTDVSILLARMISFSHFTVLQTAVGGDRQHTQCLPIVFQHDSFVLRVRGSLLPYMTHD
jgi:hypothetical protein